MSLPKRYKQAVLAFVAGIGMVASGVGFGLAPASAVTPGQLEATNFVVTSPRCGEVQFSWDYVGGPDGWFIDRDAVNNGPTVATGSVATATGTVTGIVVTGQPAGDNEYALYGSRGGLPAATRVIVTVAACPTDDGTTVTPLAATSVDTCGINGDTYTVPSKDGVVYKVDGVIKAAGTYQATGAVTVTAHPANETVVLEGKTSWTFEFTNVPCQSDPVIAPKASLSSECEIVDGEKSGLTVVNAVLNNTDSSEEVFFEVAETLDGTTEFYPIPVAAGEEITPQVFYSEADGKVSLVINARDVTLATLSFDTAGCVATVTPPPPPPTKVCPAGTKWVDVNANNTVDKGECKTPVTHKPVVKLVKTVKAATASDNSVPPADTGWEAHQGQGSTTSPWLMVFTLLGGVALLIVAAAKSRRQGAHRD